MAKIKQGEAKKEECKQNPFVEAFWCWSDVFLNVISTYALIPFMVLPWGAQAGFLPDQTKQKGALQVQA